MGKGGKGKGGKSSGKGKGKGKGGKSKGAAVCYNCMGLGHLVRECPKDPMCDSCGSVDHMKKDCDKKDHHCSTCDKVGHTESRCYKNRPEPCWNCLKVGHRAGECEEPKLCRACGDQDHLGRECPHKESVCPVCERTGHTEARCFKATSEAMQSL